MLFFLRHIFAQLTGIFIELRISGIIHSLMYTTSASQNNWRMQLF